MARTTALALKELAQALQVTRASYYAPGFGRNDSAATGEQASSSTPSTSSHSSETKSDGVVSEEDTIEYKPGE